MALTHRLIADVGLHDWVIVCQSETGTGLWVRGWGGTMCHRGWRHCEALIGVWRLRLLHTGPSPFCWPSLKGVTVGLWHRFRPTFYILLCWLLVMNTNYYSILSLAPFLNYNSFCRKGNIVDPTFPDKHDDRPILTIDIMPTTSKICMWFFHLSMLTYVSKC